MKRLGTVALMAVLVLGLSLYLGACSSGGGGGSDSGGGGGGGTISTSSQAASASAGGVQSTSLASNSGMSLSNLAEGGSQSGPAIRFKTPLAGKDAKFNAVHAAQTKAMKVQKAKLASAVKKAKAVSTGKRAPVVLPPSAPEPCADGGSSSFSGSVDNVTNEFTLTMTYNQCRELDEELNGESTVSGTFSTTGNDTFTMKLGDADGAIESTDFMVRLFSANYVDVYATYLSDMTLTGSSTCSDASCTTFTATFSGTGGEKYDDFINVYTFTYDNFSVTGSDTTTATGYTSSYTINGGISESWSDAGTTEGVSITFTSFALTFTDTATYYEETADGSVTMTFTPVDYCYGGTFTIDTVTPVRTLYSTGKTTAGEVVINSVVTIKYNADGTVTVTLTGSAATTYLSDDEFEAVCEIQEKEPEDSTVTTVSSGSTTTTSGTTLLATLTWTGTGCPTTGCTSDMDLHLEYYASTTPAAGTADWHIYFGNSDPADVLPNDDLSTLEITNADSETIGGNEGNLDFDDMNGYGPEHMTIDPIAAGYYVLYVDPYGMDSDGTAVVTVTVKIGGNAYSFPTHTFANTDTAIHRVCDIKVEANGTVTILQPNLNLTTVYAPAVRAPKVR